MAKILLVEDALDLARLIERELKAAGYEVIVTDDGLSALDLHASQQPDLMILDWVLPGLDGLEVLRRLRQSSGTPVLMLTGRNDEIDRIVGLEVGADDYLVKPFSMREMVARTRAMLRRVDLMRQTLTAASEMPKAPLTYKAISLDPQAHRATMDSELLDLTPTEFDLLHLFLQYPGRAFDRAYLLETVWGEASIGDDRAVDNTVSRLRKKLGALGEAVETVRGIGYRLRADA